MLTQLFETVDSAGIRVNHACEVGVYLPDVSNVRGWIAAGVRTTLVECDPVIVRQLQERFGALPNVRIEAVAVADAAGRLTLFRAGASTFGSNVLQSPAIVNDGYRKEASTTFEVAAVTFDAIDDGTIDLLSIDIEGGEWFVLRHMRSRPEIISVETHGKRYVNPHLREILAWCDAEGYGAWYRDRSDTVFRRGWTAPVEDRSPPMSLFRRIKKAVRGW
jgi:FkbM family methyltransferase